MATLLSVRSPGKRKPMTTKPVTCGLCPFKYSSTGFVPDYDESLVQLALPTLFSCVLRMPNKDDIVSGLPMSGRGGKYWEKEFLLPLGIRREQIIITNVIRCYPKSGEFPVGVDRKRAVEYCRRYDQALQRYRPNIWGITIHPGVLLKAPNMADFLRRALKRAKEFAEAGYRPCLLMGEEAKETFAPWLDGSMKKWQGHWYEGDRNAA